MSEEKKKYKITKKIKHLKEQLDEKQDAVKDQMTKF